jgi:hypothetical protein
MSHTGYEFEPADSGLEKRTTLSLYNIAELAASGVAVRFPTIPYCTEETQIQLTPGARCGSVIIMPPEIL